jgi:hypothetical protein
MERHLPARRTLRPVDWERVGAIGLWAVVLVMLPMNIHQTFEWIANGAWVDWWTLKQAGQDAGTAAIYGTEYPYRWSPLAAYAFAYIPNVELWVALHISAALLLRPWWLIPLVLLSFPFGEDARVGNVLVFVVVIAMYAMRGKSWAVGVYLALLLLIPRPLMVPLAVWLLWQHPEWRWRFAAMFAVNAVAVAWTGLGDDWVTRLLASNEIGHWQNFGPSRWLGVVWLPIGLALAAFLTWRGRLGLAGMAASPHLLPYYYLFLVLEFVHVPGDRVLGRLGRSEPRVAAPEPAQDVAGPTPI